MCLAFGTGRVPPAMTSGRAYRPALAQADVFAWLEQRAGTMFDPRCLEVPGSGDRAGACVGAPAARLLPAQEGR